MRSQSSHPWVQPVVVLKTGSHEATVRLGVLASLLVGVEASQPEAQARFDAWLSGPFTKTVRRASTGALVKALDSLRAEGAPVKYLEAEGAAVVATWPYPREELPKLLSKLQVSGTDFPRGGAEEASLPRPETVALSVLSTLTTGKATAQAAHALWQWWLQATEEERGSWRAAACPLTLHLLSAEELAVLAEAHPSRGIWDAGLTEIAPHTLTALAL